MRAIVRDNCIGPEPKADGVSEVANDVFDRRLVFCRHIVDPSAHCHVLVRVAVPTQHIPCRGAFGHSRLDTHCTHGAEHSHSEESAVCTVVEGDGLGQFERQRVHWTIHVRLKPAVSALLLPLACLTNAHAPFAPPTGLHMPRNATQVTDREVMPPLLDPDVGVLGLAVLLVETK